MTDLDVFCRIAAVGWRGVARSLRDRADPEVCGPQIGTALAKHLRSTGGMTSPEFTGLLRERGAGASPTTQDVVWAMEQLFRRRVGDRLMPQLVGGCYRSKSDAEEHMAQCLDAARLPELADRLLRHPGGTGLRRLSQRHLPLADLLVEPAPLGARWR